MTDEQLKVVITYDNTQAKQGFSETQKAAVQTGEDMQQVSSAINAGVNPSLASMGALLQELAPELLLIAAAAAAFKMWGDVIGFVAQQTSEDEHATAQLEAVIKSTGNAAGVSAEQAKMWSEQLQDITGVSDDAILASENLTLTFVNIKSNIFPQVTQTALDLSQAFGSDLQSATIMLDKALQDPIQGLTAMRRVGLSFSDAETQMIKTMVEHNRIAAAQGLILQEVQKQVAGSAEAMGNTIGGALAKIQNVFGDAAKTIGAIFSPVVGAVLGDVAKFAQSFFNALRPAFAELEVSMRKLGQALSSPDIKDGIAEFSKTLGDALATISPAVFDDIIAAVQTFAQLVAQYGPTVVRQFISIAQVVLTVTSAISALVSAIKSALTYGAQLGSLAGLPGFAGGVTNFSGGLAVVGENGPETVVLPKGSSVLPDGGAAGRSAAGITINGNVSFIVQGGQTDLDSIMRQINTQVDSAGYAT